MKSVGIDVLFNGFLAVYLIAKGPSLAAQEQPNAATQAPSAASGQAQAAVALVSKQYIINQDVKVAGTKKPLPKDGTWGVRQAQAEERVAECETAGTICREVLYHAGQPEIVCGWTVLFPATGREAKVVNLNDASTVYMLRFFTTADHDTPKKINGQPPLMPPIAAIARMTGTVLVRAVVDKTGERCEMSQ